MALCTDCEKLVDQLKDTPPHRHLVLEGTRKWTGGIARGVVRRYRCGQCGQTWTCDHDSQDAGCGWDLVPG